MGVLKVGTAGLQIRRLGGAGLPSKLEGTRLFALPVPVRRLRGDQRQFLLPAFALHLLVNGSQDARRF
jgi:hypothetical protein